MKISNELIKPIFALFIASLFAAIFFVDEFVFYLKRRKMICPKCGNKGMGYFIGQYNSTPIKCRKCDYTEPH